jgi:hypothetical protein
LLDEEERALLGQRGKGPIEPHVLPDLKVILLREAGFDDTVRFGTEG